MATTKRRWTEAEDDAIRTRYEAATDVGSGVPVAYYRELVALYGGLCAYCGKRPAETMDHVMPLSRGGEHAIDNVLPACKKCNFEKHDKTLDEWVATCERR